MTKVALIRKRLTGGLRTVSEDWYIIVVAGTKQYTNGHGTGKVAERVTSSFTGRDTH